MDVCNMSIFFLEQIFLLNGLYDPNPPAPRPTSQGIKLLFIYIYACFVYFKLMERKDKILESKITLMFNGAYHGDHQYFYIP